MEYRFYGWENAAVRDASGLTPCDYYDLLSEIWCAETCAPRMREEWTPENRTLGQCSITAFLIQDLYGGKVYGVPLGDGNYHCFNDVNGCVFDLTSEQFGSAKLDYTNCPEQERTVHFAKSEKKARYELLKARLNAKRPVIVPVTMAHLDRYSEIYAAAFSGAPWNDPWKREDAAIHIRELLEIKQSYGLEYASEGVTAGFILGTSMLFHCGRTFEIHDLAVDPAWQKKGIASKLLQRCIADVKEQGMAGVNLLAAAEGVLPGFYERHGFKKDKNVILLGLET